MSKMATKSNIDIKRVRGYQDLKFSIEKAKAKLAYPKDEVKLVEQREELEAEYSASNTELLRRNAIVLRVLTEVSQVLDQPTLYGELYRTLSKCSQYSHLKRVSYQITQAKLQLSTASKILKFAKSRSKKRKMSDPQSSLNQTVDKINEHINEAVLELNKDNKKRRGSYFETLKASVFEDLPVSLPKDKKFIVKTAPVLAMLGKGEVKGKDVENIQDDLYLIKNARLLGINTALRIPQAVKEEYALSKCKCTMHPHPLAKVGSTIEWFLLLDFQVPVMSVTFVSSMRLPTNYTGEVPEGSTLESYTWLAYKQGQQRKTIAKTVQKNLREEFEREESQLYQELEDAKNQYILYKEVTAYWADEFGASTSETGDPTTGLKTTQYDKVESRFKHLQTFLKNDQDMLKSGLSQEDIRLSVLDERRYARYAYHCHRKSALHLRKIRASIKFIMTTIEQRKIAMAKSVGAIATKVNEEISRVNRN